PHEGDWREGVVQEAYNLNDPLIVRSVKGGTGGASALSSLVSVSAPNVIIETVKQAEDGHGIIVRLYENQRNRGKVNIKAGFTLAEAHHCNLLEENETALPVEDNQVQIEITPYQIVTLRLTPQA